MRIQAFAMPVPRLGDGCLMVRARLAKGDRGAVVSENC